MVVGSYLITSIHMRIHDERGTSYIGPTNPPPLQGPLTPTFLKERAQRVFSMVPKRMKNLVLVNSALSTFDYIQACADVAEKYSDNVMVIPSLLALLTYALEELSNFRNPPSKEVVLVVIMAPEFYDFVILRRDQNFLLYIAEYEHFEALDQFKQNFAEFYDYSNPHSTILLVHETICNVAEEIQYEFKPENCFIRKFKHWHFILLYGGMLRAMDDEDGFDTRYHIANFTHGYETSFYNYKTQKQERHVILPPRSAVPCNVYLPPSIPTMLIKIYYSSEYYQVGDELIPARRTITKSKIVVPVSSNQAFGYVDERGVPYFTNSPAFKNRELHKNQESEKQNLEKDDPVESVQNLSASVSDTVISSKPSSSSISNILQIKFLFRDDFYAVEVLQNGSSKLLTDCSGNEWTPLYLSMAESTVEIGEKAKSHYATFPKHVIYDVLQIIGKPFNEIEINEKWGFGLIDENGSVYFQVETLSGPRLISQEIVFAAFLKRMKLQTESNLDTEVKEIGISTNLKLNESQKDIFAKAAAKNNLEILSFELM